MVFQFFGALAGVLLAAAVLGPVLSDRTVDYAVTVPGFAGVSGALAGELVISFLLMSAILHSTNSPKLARYTGLMVGGILVLYITVEAPLSGMSMNPARTVGSAMPAAVWTSWWVYFVGPIAGMLLAAEVFVRRRSLQGVICAKLHHPANAPCIFNCGYGKSSAGSGFASSKRSARSETR